MNFDTLLIFDPTHASSDWPAAPNLQTSHACLSIIESSFVFCRKQMTETIYGIFDNGLQSDLHRTEELNGFTF